MNKKTFHFRGNSKLYKYLQQYYSLDIVAGLRNFISNNDNIPLLFQAGRSGLTLELEIEELLFFMLIPANIKREIFIISFISKKVLISICPLYDSFSFIHLPTVNIDKSVEQIEINTHSLVKLAENREFKKRFLNHEVCNNKLPVKVFRIFSDRIKQYKNEIGK